jgi:hypothetical protein
MKKKSIKKAVLMLLAIMMLAVQISVCVSALNATPSDHEISDEHSSMAMASGACTCHYIIVTGTYGCGYYVSSMCTLGFRDCQGGTEHTISTKTFVYCGNH